MYETGVKQTAGEGLCELLLQLMLLLLGLLLNLLLLLLGLLLNLLLNLLLLLLLLLLEMLLQVGSCKWLVLRHAIKLLSHVAQPVGQGDIVWGGSGHLCLLNCTISLTRYQDTSTVFWAILKLKEDDIEFGTSKCQAQLELLKEDDTEMPSSRAISCILKASPHRKR